MIKRLLMILICAGFLVTLVSCKNFVMPFEDSICPQEGSWICEQSSKLGVSPESVYGWIYDASAIAVVSDAISIKEICDFEQMIADWYVSVYPATYSKLIAKIATEAGLIDDPAKALLINNILNKNLALYNNTALISPADDMILRKGHAQFRYDMLCD